MKLEDLLIPASLALSLAGAALTAPDIQGLGMSVYQTYQACVPIDCSPEQDCHKYADQ